MEIINTYTKGNKILKIYYDSDAQNPRENDNLSKFVLSHKRYTLANELNINFNAFNSWGEVEKHLKELGAVIIKSVRMYEHGNISISLNDSYPYNDYWDSGQIGFICILKNDIIKEYGKCNKANIKKAEEVLKGEFSDYKAYIEGDVYGFSLIKIHKPEYCKCCLKQINDTEEEINSCWGYYGDAGINHIKSECGF